APSTTSKAIAFPVAAVLTLIDPLPGTALPRVIAVPDRVYPLPDKLIELKTAPTRLLTLEGRAAAVGNTKLSVGIPVGAIPPAQFAAVLQLLSPPPPLQVNVAGVSRASSDSTDGRKRRNGLVLIMLTAGVVAEGPQSVRYQHDFACLARAALIH